MQTELAPRFHNQPFAAEARAILGACVHCGFCTATCPTYLDRRDERDSPRGRIYLIKSFLEGGEAGAGTRRHLDRCLTCRSCETTCPSGVRYGRLIDIARDAMEHEIPRNPVQRLLRWAVRRLFGDPALAALAMMGARFLGRLPAAGAVGAWPPPRHKRVVLALMGCVQPSATPATNAAAARILDRLGISLVAAPEAGCCGALDHHLGAGQDSRDRIRANIDAWWPAIEKGAEAILPTASGCGAMIADYGALMADDPAYADKARRVSALVRDPANLLLGENLAALRPRLGIGRVAVHVPCSQQHALGAPDAVETLLRRLGFQLVPAADKHLCCGSAGTYSIFEPGMAGRLRRRKLDALEFNRPDLIVTANVGCQLHLGAKAGVPVRHWMELLDSLPT